MFSYLILSRLLTQSVKQFASLVNRFTWMKETAEEGNFLFLMTEHDCNKQLARTITEQQ